MGSLHLECSLVITSDLHGEVKKHSMRPDGSFKTNPNVDVITERQLKQSQLKTMVTSD